MTDNKQSRASIKYDAENTKRYYLKLNNKTDADIIEKLEEVKQGEGVQTYIKRLIRGDTAN